MDTVRLDEGRKDQTQLVGFNAITGVGDLEPDDAVIIDAAAFGDPDHDLACLGELDGVAN